VDFQARFSNWRACDLQWASGVVPAVHQRRPASSPSQPESRDPSGDLDSGSAQLTAADVLAVRWLPGGAQRGTGFGGPRQAVARLVLQVPSL
jgi:hypothetical protein